MACVVDDPNGRRRIQFVAPDRSKKTLRLGKVDRKTAESICRHVEALLSAKITGQPLPRDTSVWLAGIGDVLRERLAAVGLTDEAGQGKAPRLGDWCRDYLARQTHIKAASRVATEQTIRNLLEYFGEDRAIDTLTPGDAEDFRRWLLSDGRSIRQRKGPRKLAGATVAKRLQRCGAIFADAVRRKLLPSNPFQGLKLPPAVNKERQCYVPAADVERLIEAAPSAEWRLLLAMARYLGVRVPSEPLSMTWDCVDWERRRIRVPSPKTAVHGKSFRTVPIVPEVRPHLEAVFELAPEGSRYVFEELRRRDSLRAAERGFWCALNLRQGLLRLLTRCGLRPWPRLWHNLRSSAQTDLANRFPSHVVCEWLGNTRAVAADHYLQVTDAHYEQASSGGGQPSSAAKSDALATQKATPQGSAGSGKIEKLGTELVGGEGFVRISAPLCDALQPPRIAGAELEHPSKTQGKLGVHQTRDAQSDAISITHARANNDLLTLPNGLLTSPADVEAQPGETGAQPRTRLTSPRGDEAQRSAPLTPARRDKAQPAGDLTRQAGDVRPAIDLEALLAAIGALSPAERLRLLEALAGTGQAHSTLPTAPPADARGEDAPTLPAAHDPQAHATRPVADKRP